MTYHIPAPVGIGPGRMAFGLASKKVNELSDYGKVVLFNDGYALNDTAGILMTIIDGPESMQMLVYRDHFAGG